MPSLSIIAVILFSTFLISCTKDPDIPQGVSTNQPFNATAIDIKITKGNVSYTTADFTVSVNNTGGRKINRLVFCYGQGASTPDTTGLVYELGSVNINSPSSIFSVNITGLVHNSSYKYKLYAVYNNYTYSSSIGTFTTLNDTRLPSLLTGEIASSITTSSAYLSGTIVKVGDEFSTVTQHGHVWATHSEPTLNDSKTTLGASKTGDFLSTINNLQSGTTYYYRAYATNGYSTGYGAVYSFYTKGAPGISTGNALSITYNSAKVRCNILNNGGATVTRMGICYSTSPSPTILDKADSTYTSLTYYEPTLSNLTPGVKYYARAFARNSYGISYGNQIEFTTLSGNLASVQTLNDFVTTSYPDWVTCKGTILSNGGQEITSAGFVCSTKTNPTVSSYSSICTSNATSVGEYDAIFKGLTANTTYYTRSYVTTSVGTAYGDEYTFTTKAATKPVVYTNSVSSSYIKYTDATCTGKIYSTGGYGITQYGICYSTASNPTISNSIKICTSPVIVGSNYSVNITGLSDNTIYYYRAYATNSLGTSYGSNYSFTTKTISAPSIGTISAEYIAHNLANFFVSNISNNGSLISEYGICWNTTGSPLITDNKKVTHTGTYERTSFYPEIDELDAKTTYYARAYVINSKGITYSNVITFTTLDSAAK